MGRDDSGRDGEGQGVAATAFGATATMLVQALKPLQQPVEVVEFIAWALALAGAPAKLLQDFPGPLQIGFVRHLDVARIHLAGPRYGAAQRVLGLAELIQLVGVALAGLP